MKPQKIEISYRTIIFTVLFLCSLFVIWTLRFLIFIFFICFMLMEALNPTIKKLEKIKIPRILGIITIYLLIISSMVFISAEVIPVLIEQTSGLIRDLPGIVQNVKILGFPLMNISSQLKLLETLPADIARTIISVFSNILSGFVIFVVTFYLLLERRHFEGYFLKFFGERGNIKALKIIETLEVRLSSWVNGELVLMTVVGLLGYLGYLVMGLKYAVPLALIAGVMEIVPNIGPIISTVLAGLVGLTVSPVLGLTAVIWGIVVQQLENNFIVPKIMKEAVGLNPLVTIFTIAAGAQLGGIGGALLAVPIFLTLETIIKVVFSKE